MNTMKATDMSPSAGSITVVQGPPGTGKSWFAGTAAELDHLSSEEVLLISTLPREVKSAKYQEHDLDTIMVLDEDWVPDKGSLKATGYDKLLDVLKELRDDTDYGAIVIDNGTEMAEQAWHASLAPLGVSDPVDLGRGNNSFEPYVKIREKLEQIFNSLGYLTGRAEDAEGNVYETDVARPKLITIPWHVQTPNEGDDEDAQGVEYEGKFLPMIRGQYRRKMAGVVDNVIFSDCIRDPKSSALKRENLYVVQVVKDGERHAKISGPEPEREGLIERKYIRNSWPRFWELLA